MNPGSVVEFIDRQKILCAVVLESQQQRLRLLTENDREVKLSANRLSHRSDIVLNLGLGRSNTVRDLKDIALRRRDLMQAIDVRELWEVLGSENEWIDLKTMTAICFPDSPNGDHESAVVRAFFLNRLYFRFQMDRFFPYTGEQVQQRLLAKQQEEHRNRIIETGGRWLKELTSGKSSEALAPEAKLAAEISEILQSYYLHEKDSEHSPVAKALMTRAGIQSEDRLFDLLVRLGAFGEHENCDLLRLEIPTSFSPPVLERTAELVAPDRGSVRSDSRRDLTHLPAITIDGQATLDYDDALSIETDGRFHRLGIHIVDVGHFIEKGDVIDAEAARRGSSIYMPDDRIPMLPEALAEGLCSLKAGEERPAVSILATVTPNGHIDDFEICSSKVKVQRQLTYYDVNLIVDQDPELDRLRTIADTFRRKRMDEGAVQITLPEIHVWVEEKGDVAVHRVNRESPARLLVSETMILANWLMARFLRDQGLPAVFRSQPEPRERLYRSDGGTLFQNYMQRRLLNRFLLDHRPEHHSGLGLDAYVTATSPIRKYVDLVTQRQVRAALGLEAPYSTEEIDDIIQRLRQPMSHVALVQRNRNRYWLLRYLEQRVGCKEEAIVLMKKRNTHQVLLTDYMIECDLPASSGVKLDPGDFVQITLQHVDARRNLLTVFLG